ncbi:hypothetical protein T484DRAFT_1906295, partial [Baffinella frigidus]
SGRGTVPRPLPGTNRRDVGRGKLLRTGLRRRCGQRSWCEKEQGAGRAVLCGVLCQADGRLWEVGERRRCRGGWLCSLLLHWLLAGGHLDRAPGQVRVPRPRLWANGHLVGALQGFGAAGRGGERCAQRRGGRGRGGVAVQVVDHAECVPGLLCCDLGGAAALERGCFRLPARGGVGAAVRRGGTACG